MSCPGGDCHRQLLMESSSSLATGCCSTEQFRKEMECAICSGRHYICNTVSANIFYQFLLADPDMELHCVFWPVTTNECFNHSFYAMHIQRAGLKTHFLSHRGNCLFQYYKDLFNSSARLGGIGHRCFWVMLQRGDEFSLPLCFSGHQYLA